jgi:ribosomal protein S27E
MQGIDNLISSEMRFPNDTSKKKKRFITFKCTTCGKVDEKVYQKARWKSQCESCLKGLFTTEQFIQMGRQHFGDLYDYTKTNYTGKRNQVIIICSVHGEFMQRAQEHMAGHGCNKCKFDMKSENQKLPEDVWLTRLKKYPLITTKGLNELGYHTQVTLTCKIHGDFTVALGQIGQSKHLCQDCAYTAHQTQSIRTELIGKPATLYYVYLPKIGMYKLGVTTNLNQRLKTLGECKLIATGVKEYTEACKYEHRVHKQLHQYHYQGRKTLVKNGSTELFVIDVLPQIKRALQQ